MDRSAGIYPLPLGNARRAGTILGSIHRPTFQETAVYAIIEDSGTQIKVAPGDVLEVDLRDSNAGDSVTFDRVLMIGDEGADSPATIGTPYVEGASVVGEVVDEIKGEKIDVVKFKRRKGYRVKQGHRQKYLRVKINDIKS